MKAMISIVSISVALSSVVMLDGFAVAQPQTPPITDMRFVGKPYGRQHNKRWDQVLQGIVDEPMTTEGIRRRFSSIETLLREGSKDGTTDRYDDEPGYTRYPVDLNATVKGKYIYLETTRDASKGTPITRIGFVAFKQNVISSPFPGWEMKSQDLNDKAGGPYIYCFIGRAKRVDGKELVPLTDIVFVVPENGKNAPTKYLNGYQLLDIDLNMESDDPGRKIFPYVHFDDATQLEQPDIASTKRLGLNAKNIKAAAFFQATRAD